ncbi:MULTISPECIES: DUF4235 domain-containing protein [unclassified Arsukibacterium]|uniref:DUF4235 domain-containing protein n=1 Tax=unclassified Arsukibacterium TaxID=2635278 RepID=UPI000C8C4BB4|nr:MULTISPECIES: DUF4235 domain-containing protein [unclassified Arsukibacterium]MAA95495.1 hypothetical protein [Rheinheimera sp.]HAW92737.1 hypothetical protein [Candidatus Azambacteria bacterium]|tara:strand:+ start:54346 stop:54591 length:246 start_codon:yes stop_codon:yes gene_type:complete
MSNKQLISTIGIGLAAASVSMLTRKSVQKSWEKITDKPAPKDKASSDVELKEAIAWAVVSGISAGVARMVVHYVADKRHSQ